MWQVPRGGGESTREEGPVLLKMEQVLRVPQRHRKHGLMQASERPVCRIRKGTLLGKNHRAMCIMGRHSERQGYSTPGHGQRLIYDVARKGGKRVAATMAG